MPTNKYAKYVQPQPAPEPVQQEAAPAKPNKYAKYAQPVTNAGPSLRSETDAIIEEAAANIPGGYEAFNRKPADPQRMAAMGYVPDPLAKSGYAKPVAPQAPIADTGTQNNVIADIVRGLEAPVAGLTGGGLTGWAKTTQEDPLLGATQAVEFISPVDDAARAYQGVKQAGAGLIDGDMAKAGQGAQQALIEGSYTAMQALPGSMTLRGVTAPARAAPTTLAAAERAAVQATQAPSVRVSKAKAAPAPVVAPKPYSAPPEPAGGGIVRRNADRIVGAGIGATVGGVGDAYAAPADGESDSGPLNAGTGAAIGFFGPRAVASAASRGFRAAARPFAPRGFDERVAARAVRNALKSGGIRSAEEAQAVFTARFGDKPASIADLTQDGVGTAAGISRLPGATGEAARARGEELLGARAGRLERDIGDVTGASPATIAGDVDRMVQLARQQATPAYAALREQNPFGSFASSRLEQLRDLDILRPHIQGVDRYRDTLAATEGRVVGDFEYWDLVKRSLDDAEQSAIARNQAVPYDLDSARQAIVREVDALVPGYAAARQLGGEAPRMQEAFRQGQGLLGGRYTAEDVSRLAQGVTGQQLTALQAGVIRSMVAKTEGPRGAMASLMSAGSRRKLAEVFGPEAADAMQARFAADAAIMENAQRINPNVGSVTSQAQMGGGVLPVAAEAIRTFRSPVEAALAAMSKSGSYTKAQRDLMGQMLLEGATPENLARIFGNRGGRQGGNIPPAPQGPPPRTGNALNRNGGPDAPPPAPTNAFNAPPRVGPSAESVAEAISQVRNAREAQLPERDRIGAWQGEVPQKPQSLLAWIRSQGGINDRNYMSGDVRAIMGRANAMPGLINRQSGQGLDDIVAAAYHQGFDVDPDDANSLMRLIEEEVAGNPSYRIGAREEWDVYQEYLASRRGDLPGQTSRASPTATGIVVGGGIGAATNPDDPGKGAVVGAAAGGVGGAVLGNRLRPGAKPPKAPPAVKPPANWPPKPMADPPAPGKIRAYHGSKHEFDEFKLTDETVGTGEGTQSRGYGLYFAERPNLANFYRQVGQNSGSPEDFAGSLLYHEGGDVEKVRAFLKGEIKKAGRTDPTLYKQALAALNKGRATDMSAKQGAFYEVDLNAQGDDLFDLDAPLSGQTEIVRSRVADAWQKLKGDAPLDPQASGYDILMAMGNNKAASDALSANGIKGAQFLDRASREARSGTRNYVMFNPADVAVRNRQSATPKPPPQTGNGLTPKGAGKVPKAPPRR